MRNGLNTLISIEIYRLVKLILTTSVFLSTSLWASPMDKVCSVQGVDGKVGAKTTRFIRDNCERNRFYNRYS